MGVVISFLERLRTARDWTGNERARLEVVAGKIAAEASGGTHAAFGVSDAGDPWFVVKDADDEVIVHVARIGGRFVLHAMDADEIQEGPDLMALLARTLGEAAVQEVLAAHAPTVAMFGEREERTLFPALVAAALVYEALQTLPEAARRAFLLHEREVIDLAAPASMHLEAASPAEALAAPPRRAGEPAPAPQLVKAEAPPAPATEAVQDCAAVDVPIASDDAIFGPAADETPAAPARPTGLAAVGSGGGGGIVLIGTAQNDVLVGTPGADLLQGGAGEDALDGGGAPEGQVDVLDGGAGDDVLILGPNVVATGGEGADDFVIAANFDGPRPPGPRPLGVVLDFAPDEGDRLVFAGHMRADIVSQRPQADVLAELRGAPGVAGLRTVAGERVGLDFDGDGKEDAYVMVGLGGSAPHLSAEQRTQLAQLHAQGLGPPPGEAWTLVEDAATPTGTVTYIGLPPHPPDHGGG